MLSPAIAQQAYEPLPVLRASKILPPELLTGPNHRVEESVYNDGYLNRYTVSSKFGGVVAVSTPMLRKRISEINAMVRMEQIKGTKEFTSSLKEAGIGGSSGEGVLSYQGKDYPFTISGFNVADVGVANFHGAGKVYDLKNLQDFSGNMPPPRQRSRFEAARASFPCATPKG